MRSLAKLLSKSSAQPLAQPTPHAAPSGDIGHVSDEARRRAIDAAGAHVAAGRFGDALARIDEATALAPHDGELAFARASVMYSWGRFWDARVADRDALRLGFATSDVYVHAGWAAFSVGNADEALASMREAVKASSDSWTAQFGFATVSRALKSLDESLDASKRAVELNPDDFHCLTGLCATLVERCELDEAEACARQIVDRFPNHPLAWATLGGVLDHRNRFDDALLAYDRCEALGVSSPEAADEYFNRVICLMRAGRTQEALAVMERNFPQRANARAQGHYALALLIRGRLAEGWEQYEFRWMKEPLSRARPNFVKPGWTGQDLRGRTILLRTEQGHGDFIQFIRYAKHVKALGATVLLALREEMRPLAEQLTELDRILKPNEPYPPFDFYANLMSLPRAFGTDVNSIPVGVPYLHVDPARFAEWRERIPSDAGVMNVGVAWAGSPTHVRDKFRSLRLEQLAPLAGIERVRFYSLQKGPAAAECASPPSGMALVDLDVQLHDYGDTAAAISCLHLVIAVDTSVAHLAGALGKPVWVLLPDPADFRWMQQREDTAWYPTMRLFRQKSPGVWDGAIAEVAQALRERAAGNPLAASADSTNGIEASRAPRILTPVARRVEYVVPGLAQVAETRFGLMQYLPDEPRVGESLRRYGEYLHGQLMILAAVGLGNRLVVEASAGVGHHALFLASALRPDGHVILYENDHRLRRLLRENLSSNGLANTTVMRRPLREAPVSENVVASEASAPASEIIDDLRLQHLDWLKIGERVDAAGILAGASDTIWRTRPKLFVAGSDAPTVGKLAQQVRDFGYSCWRVSTPTFNPDNFNLCSEASSDDVLAFALLALPEEAGREMSFSECERLV